jgi:cold shock CspA family protein
MAESWNKKEREKKKQKEKKDKADKMKERKENPKSGGMDNMIAYVDEFGNFSSTPPDPRRKVEIKLEDIEIGVPKYVAPTEAELIRNGKVSFFNTDKGFGFIKDNVTQESLFIHANNLTEPIKENDKVSFEIEMGQRGPMAVNVKIIN